MKSKNTYILLFVFLALIVIAYFLTTERGEKTSTYKIEEKFFKIDSALVDKLEFETKGKKYVFAKEGIEWRIKEPIDYPANSQSITSILHDLKKYKLESKVSDNPENKVRYGFHDTTVMKISVYQGGNLVGSFLMGGSAGMRTPQTYVKKLEGNDIYIADGIDYFNFIKYDWKEWMDKIICAIPKTTIKEIEFISKEESFKVTSDSAKKYYIGKDSVNTSIFDGILNLLQNFNTETFKDTTLAQDTKFDATVKVYADKVYEFNFLKIGESPNYRYILKATDKPLLFEMSEGLFKNLFRTKKEILTGKAN